LISLSIYQKKILANSMCISLDASAQSRGQLVELQFPEDAADWQRFLFIYTSMLWVWLMKW